MAGTVLFLGAGATKSVNGPMTSEILPKIYQALTTQAAIDPQGRPAKLKKFLDDEFHLRSGLSNDQYPGLPLLMSLLDRRWIAGNCLTRIGMSIPDTNRFIRNGAATIGVPSASSGQDLRPIRRGGTRSG